MPVKKIKLGLQVERSEIYNRRDRDPLDHETFFGHLKITRAPLQPQAGDHCPAPDLEVGKDQLKAPLIQSAVLPDDVRKRDPAAVRKVIFEAVGVPWVVDITGIPGWNSMRDRIQISAHSAAVDRKQKHEAHFCRFQREGRHQTLELTLQQVLLPCPFRRCRQIFSSCTFHELSAASSFVT